MWTAKSPALRFVFVLVVACLCCCCCCGNAATTTAAAFLQSSKLKRFGHYAGIKQASSSSSTSSPSPLSSSSAAAETAAATKSGRQEQQQQQRRRLPERPRRASENNSRIRRRRGGQQSRRPGKQRTVPSVLVPFDGRALAQAQAHQEDTAQPLDLSAAVVVAEESSSHQNGDDVTPTRATEAATTRLICKSDDILADGTTSKTTSGGGSSLLNLRGDAVSPQPPFAFYSLDEVLQIPGFSERFSNDGEFRTALRDAIRRDVIDTTPFYSTLSDKVRDCFFRPGASLEGSWRSSSATKDPSDGRRRLDSSNNNDGDDRSIRMQRTTRVLEEASFSAAMTGDDLLHRIGRLCGTHPSTHWIDIVGIQNRAVRHSWHQDCGQLPPSKPQQQQSQKGAAGITSTTASASTKTVLWGFPSENGYEGCGVFSHVVSLAYQCHRRAIMEEDDEEGEEKGRRRRRRRRMEPVLFTGTVDEKYIVRPRYAPGREILVYGDVDVLHSAPDVTYRTSVMRFM